jgi:Protein of unknown function (DUF1501)
VPDDEEFEARVDDLAFKMQTEAPAVFDIWWESTKMLEMCAVGKPPPADYGRRCLMAQFRSGYFCRRTR